MCRWLAYSGTPIRLEELLVKRDRSLIDQSLHARQGATPTNGDGFGVGWYDEHGNDVDRAALTLCRLRRASAGRRGSPEHGDEAVRDALDGVNSGAIVWLLSRAISYMDETGFPEAVEPWFPDEEPAA